MTRWKNKAGFALSLVIVAFGLLGVVMFVLTEGSNTMLFQADTSYLQAVERNLEASGLVWAQRQARKQAGAASEGPVNLDVTALSSRPASLIVQRENAGETPTSIRIDTMCRRGRRVRIRSEVYPMP